MTTTDPPPLHPALELARHLVYAPHGLVITNVVSEQESADYAGHSLRVDGLACRFRVAKTTPTKNGQFVTLWRRSKEGPIRPFGDGDDLDLVIVSVGSDEHSGQFVFPRRALVAHGILSRPGREGKRAFRVYPPWVATESAQAARTQRWQAEHFLELAPGRLSDGARVRELYGRTTPAIP